MGDGLIQIFPKKYLNTRIRNTDFIRGQLHYIKLLKQCGYLLQIAIKIIDRTKKKSVRMELLKLVEELSRDFRD
ncbi:MAG: hypothetical protein ACPGC9_01370 [Cytophagales bacterium]